MTGFAKLTKIIDILILACVVLLSISGLVAGVIEVAGMRGIVVPDFTGREVLIGLAQPFFYCPQVILLIYFNFAFSSVYLALGISAVVFVSSFLAFIFSFKKRCWRIGYIIKFVFRMIWGLVAACGIYIAQITSSREGFILSLAVSLSLFLVALFNLALAFQPGELAVKGSAEKVPVIVQVVGQNSTSAEDATINS